MQNAHFVFSLSGVVVMRLVIACFSGAALGEGRRDVSPWYVVRGRCGAAAMPIRISPIGGLA